MAIDSTHPQYDATADQWQRIRDVMGGEDAVKARGSGYLPMLSGADHDEWNGYLTRALFYNATARTVAGLAGAIFRKDAVIEAPDVLNDTLEAVTPTNAPFSILAKQAVEEVIAVGRVGVLIDMPEDGDEPYVAMYLAEDVINWRAEYVAGEERLILAVLHETVEEQGDDEYETVEVDQWRVLKLVDGSYVQEVWREIEGAAPMGNRFVMVSQVSPSIRGRALDYIPLVLIGPTDIGPTVERSPIIDLVDVNLSHYRTSADLEHGAHFTALPTYWATAGTGSTPEYRVGSGVAWIVEPGGQAGILEYAGQGLKALEERLAGKERLMAVLGARLLEDQKKAVETADAIRLRHSGENSLLATIADTVSRGLTVALTWLAEWQSAAGDVSVQLNKDFVDVAMTPQEITAMVAAWQSGGISRETLFYNLQRGEVIPAERTFEEEVELIERDAPLGMQAQAQDMEHADRREDRADEMMAAEGA